MGNPALLEGGLESDLKYMKFESEGQAWGTRWGRLKVKKKIEVERSWKSENNVGGGENVVFQVVLLFADCYRFIT